MNIAAAPDSSAGRLTTSLAPDISCREAKAMASTQVVHSNYVPAQLHRQLQFVDHNVDGHLVLGCCDLTGRMWTGSLWYYRDPNDAPSVGKALTGVDCDSGCVDGKFIGDKKKNMLVACDDGSLHHVALSFSDEGEKSGGQDSFFFLETKAGSQEHEDIITGLDISQDGSKVITSSYDRTVVVLDVNTLRLEARLSDIHNDIISNVAANRVNSNIIATSANDGIAAAWDLRTTDTCIGKIYEDSSNWPTCVEWLPSSEFHLLVGNQSGQIRLFDIRKSDEKGILHETIDQQIQQIKFSTKRPNLFSVCGDTYKLKVLELNDSSSNLKLRYEDSRHNDFIRGMSWHPKTDELYTCGWDQQVLSHLI